MDELEKDFDALADHLNKVDMPVLQLEKDFQGLGEQLDKKTQPSFEKVSVDLDGLDKKLKAINKIEVEGQEAISGINRVEVVGSAPGGSPGTGGGVGPGVDWEALGAALDAARERLIEFAASLDLKPVLNVLGGLAGGLTGLQEGVGNLRGSLASLGLRISSLDALLNSLAGVVNVVTVAMDVLASVQMILDATTILLEAEFAILAAPIEILVAAIALLIAGFAYFTSQYAASSRSFLDRLRDWGEALSAGVERVMEFADKLDSLISKTQTWVDKLSPSNIEMFQYRLDAVQATMGKAFQPLFQVLTSTLEKIAGIIAPVFEKLRPIIDRVARVFSDVLISVVQMLAAILEALLPILSMFAELLKGLFAVLQPLIQIVAAIIQTFAQLLSALFGGVNKGFKTLTELMRNLGEWLILLSVKIATVLGAFGFIDNLKKILQPERGGGELPAIRNTQISGFEEVARQIELASAKAGGMEEDKTMEQNVAELLKRINEIDKEITPLFKVAVELLINWLKYKATVETAKQMPLIGGIARMFG